MYTILVKHFPSDAAPCTLMKRYSDFDLLLAKLKKSHPDESTNLCLPPKHVIGNFKAKVIAERSRHFEQLLAHVSQMISIRCSEEFLKFVYGSLLRGAASNIVQAKFSDALPSLLKVYVLQRKLLGDLQPQTAFTMCALAASYHEMGNNSQAEGFAKMAVECLKSDSCVLVPVLTFGIRLCWTLGKDKRSLEHKLRTLQEQGVQVEGQLTLVEAVQHHCQTLLKSY